MKHTCRKVSFPHVSETIRCPKRAASCSILLWKAWESICHATILSIRLFSLEGDKKLRARVNSNIDVYKKNSSIRKSIESEYRKLDEVRNEIMEENTPLVRTYFSLCFFDRDEKELENAEKKIRECLNLAGFGYYIPSVRASGGRTSGFRTGTGELLAGGVYVSFHALRFTVPFSCLQYTPFRCGRYSATGQTIPYPDQKGYMGCRKEKGGCTQRDDHRRFRRGKIHFRREFHLSAS